MLDVVIDEYRRQGASPERILYKRPAGLRLRGPYNEDAFAIVLRNLIENALRHGSAGGKVDITAADGEIRIVNDCPALSLSELQAVRQRFGRGRTHAGGTGLGLSIVERMLAHMNGRLELASPAAGRSRGFEARILLSPQA